MYFYVDCHDLSGYLQRLDMDCVGVITQKLGYCGVELKKDFLFSPVLRLIGSIQASAVVRQGDVLACVGPGDRLLRLETIVGVCLNSEDSD